MDEKRSETLTVPLLLLLELMIILRSLLTFIGTQASKLGAWSICGNSC